MHTFPCEEKKRGQKMRKSNQPIWLKISNTIRADIESGIYQADQKLPSLNRLAKKFDVNRNTARQALLYLQNIGLISVEQGRGTYILDKPSCIKINDNSTGSQNILDFSKLDEKLISSELIIPDVRSENILYLNEADKIWRIKSLIQSDDEPVALYSCEIQSNMLIYFKGNNVLTPINLEESARQNAHLFVPQPTQVSAGLPEYEFKSLLGIKHTIPVLVAETNYIHSTEYGGDGNVVLTFKRYYVSNRVNIGFETSHIMPISAIA